MDWLDYKMHHLGQVQISHEWRTKKKYCPWRGLRQEDPLSPFILILCTEALVSLLNHAENQGKITRMWVARAMMGSKTIISKSTSKSFVFVRKISRHTLDKSSRAKDSREMDNRTKQAFQLAEHAVQLTKHTEHTVQLVERGSWTDRAERASWT